MLASSRILQFYLIWFLSPRWKIVCFNFREIIKSHTSRGWCEEVKKQHQEGKVENSRCLWAISIIHTKRSGENCSDSHASVMRQMRAMLNKTIVSELAGCQKSDLKLLIEYEYNASCGKRFISQCRRDAEFIFHYLSQNEIVASCNPQFRKDRARVWRAR